MPQPFDPELHAAAMARTLRLELPPERLAGVVENLKRMDDLAALVMSFPLDDHVEAAPVFKA